MDLEQELADTLKYEINKELVAEKWGVDPESLNDMTVEELQDEIDRDILNALKKLKEENGI